jgi:glyoxalase family protein
MGDTIRGIHHVTAISGEAQRNVDFYVGDLGLRLVKQTVNFDDPGTHHLYYGDGDAAPGSILTFFPWEMAAPGWSGPGTTAVTGFSVRPGTGEFWGTRLDERGIGAEEVEVPGGGVALHFGDPDGMVLEIVEDSEAGDGPGVAGVDPQSGISSFHGVVLDVPAPEMTARLLVEVFGYEEVGEDAGRLRFKSPSGEPGAVVDLLAAPTSGAPRMGRGSVHHVAFRADDEKDQLEWRGRVQEIGIAVTPVMDRNYFRSIYFREPGGVLFEIATDPPGFTVDEAAEELGHELKLPEWLEPRRSEIEARLPTLGVPGRDGA